MACCWSLQERILKAGGAETAILQKIYRTSWDFHRIFSWTICAISAAMPVTFPRRKEARIPAYIYLHTAMVLAQRFYKMGKFSEVLTTLQVRSATRLWKEKVMFGAAVAEWAALSRFSTRKASGMQPIMQLKMVSKWILIVFSQWMICSGWQKRAILTQ